MSTVSQGLSTTSYALLGLLAFDRPTASSLTGYELKQRADKTLRFYWVSPAMSQIYSELDRLASRELVLATPRETGRRTTLEYRISQAGVGTLQKWLIQSEPEFPILKHPTALRLLMGALVAPEQMRHLLVRYLNQLAEQKRQLQQVRDSLGDEPALAYPALVADWGLSYYDSETTIAQDLVNRLPHLSRVRSVEPSETTDGSG
jgi:DNA-binding PadR family transcriptional regulator